MTDELDVLLHKMEKKDPHFAVSRRVMEYALKTGHKNVTLEHVYTLRGSKTSLLVSAKLRSHGSLFEEVAHDEQTRSIYLREYRRADDVQSWSILCVYKPLVVNAISNIGCYFLVDHPVASMRYSATTAHPSVNVEPVVQALAGLTRATVLQLSNKTIEKDKQHYAQLTEQFAGKGGTLSATDKQKSFFRVLTKKDLPAGVTVGVASRLIQAAIDAKKENHPF